jgi:predicted nucleic acid-binding Zn ribbon protein
MVIYGILGYISSSRRMYIMTANSGYCPNCSAPIPSGNRFCKKCGTQLPVIQQKGSGKRNQKVWIFSILGILLVVAIVIVVVASVGGDNGGTSSGSGQSKDRSQEAIALVKGDEKQWRGMDSMTDAYGTPNIFAFPRQGFTDVYVVQVEFPNGIKYEWIVDFREYPAKITYRGEVY